MSFVKDMIEENLCLIESVGGLKYYIEKLIEGEDHEYYAKHARECIAKMDRQRERFIARWKSVDVSILESEDNGGE